MLELKKCSQIIGKMDKDGLVSRIKLLHWIGCDKDSASSNIHVLDLAKFDENKNHSDSEKGSPSNTVQQSSLDRIFGNLDVIILSSFSDSSTRSQQLVENYIKTHSKQNGTFTITDEFDNKVGYTSTMNNIHHMVAPYVTFLTLWFLIENPSDVNFEWICIKR